MAINGQIAEHANRIRIIQHENVYVRFMLKLEQISEYVMMEFLKTVNEYLLKSRWPQFFSLYKSKSEVRPQPPSSSPECV